MDQHPAARDGELPLDDGCRTPERLRVDAALFSDIAEHAPTMIWVADPDAACIYLNRSWSEFTGQTVEDGLGVGWLDMLHSDDREAVWEAFRAANRRREAYSVEYRLQRVDGSYRWVLDTARPRFADDGRYLGYVGSVLDIDDRRRAEEEQRILVAELQHRTRNLLAVVRGMAQQTERASGSLAEFADKFQARLSALSRVQGLLSRSERQRVPLRELVEGELQAHGAGAEDRQVTVRGPRVLLAAKTVQALSLALHELATNAMKHGALAQPEAKLAVTWSVSQGEDGRILTLCWTETGVEIAPQVEVPRGFGRQLIERALPYDLRATSCWSLSADGVRCELRVPLDEARAA